MRPTAPKLHKGNYDVNASGRGNGGFPRVAGRDEKHRLRSSNISKCGSSRGCRRPELKEHGREEAIANGCSRSV